MRAEESPFIPFRRRLPGVFVLGGAMLTPGNAKLGTDLIWGFGLPSGGSVCVGMTKVCRAVCYAVRTEQYRPKAAARKRPEV